MSSKKISFPEVMFSVASAKYGQVLQALRIWITFLTSVTGCQSLLFPCWEICWFCSLKAAAYTSFEGEDYTLGRFFFLLHLKTLLLYPLAKTYFLRRSAVHLLEELTFWLLPNAPISKEAFENDWGIYSCVQERGIWISSWSWHGGATEQASVTVSSNTCPCILKGWSVNEQLSLSVSGCFFVCIWLSFILFNSFTFISSSILTRVVMNW